MAVIWVSDKCSICGGQIKDGEKVVLVSVVKTTDIRAKDSTYYRSADTIRVNFIPHSDERKLKHLACSDDFQQTNDKDSK